ncbi:DUF933 domain-containing protein [bacterium]|nr:DUF933 domain-containing protein [bacterium]
MYKIGLFGYSYSGKTSIFKAITGKTDDTYNPLRPNVGIGKFKDKILDEIVLTAKSEKTIYSEFEFFDFKGMPETTGFSDDYLKQLLETELIIGVVKNYDENSKPEQESTSLIMELVFFDIARIEKLLSSNKGLLPQQIKILETGLKLLEQEKLLNTLDSKEIKILQGIELLTIKPILIFINGEEKPYTSQLQHIKNNILEFDEEQFYANIIQRLSLTTFYTIKGKMSQSWLVSNTLNAKESAGKVHKDIEKGFIRAAVVSYKDFLAMGDWQKVKSAGGLKFLGPNSKISDKDIVEFYFN